MWFNLSGIHFLIFKVAGNGVLQNECGVICRRHAKIIKHLQTLFYEMKKWFYETYTTLIFNSRRGYLSTLLLKCNNISRIIGVTAYDLKNLINVCLVKCSVHLDIAGQNATLMYSYTVQV